MHNIRHASEKKKKEFQSVLLRRDFPQNIKSTGQQHIICGPRAFLLKETHKKIKVWSASSKVPTRGTK